MEPIYGTNVYYDNLPQDLENLSDKLAFFQALVVDGEAKRLDDPSVGKWMDDLKDLLYHVEDILDDLKSPSNDQVRVDHDLYLNSNEIRKRLSVIMGKIEVLKYKAKDLKLKRGRGHASSGESKVTLRTRETSSIVDKYEIIHGREEDKTIIVKKLLKVDDKAKKSYDVLCIVGMGGLGKTTLARLVFNDPDVVKHFDVKCWVCISNIFDVVRATRELIINSDHSKDGRSVEHLPLEGLHKRLSEMVEKKKFLFVLDDVWSSKEYEMTKVPFSSCANGSKILVTTRNIKIANAFGNENPYQLQGLNQEQSMKLFRDKAFGDDDGEIRILIMNLVEKIVGACGGVPLVVKVIGSMLQGADVKKWADVSKNTDHWVHNADEIHPAIRFSYYDLPASLKRCFEYLAVFPPDHLLTQDEVVRLWIADRLVQDMEGRMAEDIGKEYYSDLKARSLIQKDDMMHDIVHHLATVVSGKFCYKENLKEPAASVRHAFPRKLNEMHYKRLAQAPCLRTLIVNLWEDENILRKTIRSCKMLRTLVLRNMCILSLPESICTLSRLQDLYLDNCFDLKQLPEDIGNLKRLQTLDLTWTSIASLPESICALNQLQDLKLRYCRHLKQLPIDIGNLKSLRTLDLSNTSISSLPESICALCQLQDLNLGSCRHLEQLSEDIGNLKSLWTLDLSNTSISSLPESICALCQLQDLNLGSCRHLEQLLEDIGNLKSLWTLDLSNTSISSLPESICTLCQLQDLNLGSCRHLEQLPEDIGNLKSLWTLDLSNTSISSLPESICALCQLQDLNLGSCRHLEQLQEDIGNLKSLRTLNLRKSSISSLPESIYALSQLQDLDLGFCKSLKEVPKDIGNLTNLRRLCLEATKLSTPLSILTVTGHEIFYEHLALHIGSLERDGGLWYRTNIIIGGVEEALMADLKSKNVRTLKLCCSQAGNDKEMEMKIVEALEPHHALKELRFSNYGGDKFPTWIMPSNICFGKLTLLRMKRLNKICEMVGMEFVALQDLEIEKCPILRMISIATPKLDLLTMKKCGELEAVQLLPTLSDKAGTHSIVSQLRTLRCAYNIFETFFEKLQTANSKWNKLYIIELSGEGRRVASLPGGWPSMMDCIETMDIVDIGPGKFQFLPDGDQSTFPSSLNELYINYCEIEERLPHHSYTLTSDGKVEVDSRLNRSN